MKAGLSSNSENYRLYRSTTRDRTYLVVSTFFDQPKSKEEPGEGFVATDARALGAEMQAAQSMLPQDPTIWERGFVQVTLRAHGYNTRFGDFISQVVDEADPDPDTTLRPGNRFYIGYRWPSVGVGSWRSIVDTVKALGITRSISLFLLLIPALALTRLRHAAFFADAMGPYALPILAAVLLGVGIGFLANRSSTYLSDRYRALHYGVPDLAEFVRDLDDQINPMRIRADIDMVGHSMGCLLLVNAVRIMTDFFHYPGDEGETLSRAAMIRLRSLILCAADIPIALAVPGRNNYFLSSLRRFSAIHVLSSDHDIILKWASNLGNWASEPRYDMSSRRLGNAFLTRRESAPKRLHGHYLVGSYLPVTRPGQRYLPAADPPWKLQAGCREARLYFHDCSRCWSVGGDLTWAAGSALVALLVGLALWFSSFGVLAKFGSLARWAAILIWLGYVVGFLSRWLQRLLGDHWVLGSAVAMLSDWPSTTAFSNGKRNPHGGYFIRGDTPRRVIADLIAQSGAGERWETGWEGIRSGAIRIPVGPPEMTSPAKRARRPNETDSVKSGAR